jgi:hypothetical protein
MVQHAEEVIMETLLLIIGVVVIALLVFRSAPRTQIIYVPVEVAEPQGGLGCLPLIVVAVLVLLALGAIRV